MPFFGRSAQKLPAALCGVEFRFPGLFTAGELPADFRSSGPMGLFPDLSRSKSTASFYASQKNYLPFCLGNEFKSEGVQTWAYHNYSGEYYSRNVTHPNMGYTFQSATDGLDIPLSWPSSDLDMQSVFSYLPIFSFLLLFPVRNCTKIQINDRQNMSFVPSRPPEEHGRRCWL